MNVNVKQIFNEALISTLSPSNCDARTFALPEAFAGSMKITQDSLSLEAKRQRVFIALSCHTSLGHQVHKVVTVPAGFSLHILLYPMHTTHSLICLLIYSRNV